MEASMKDAQDIIEEIVGAYEYGYRGPNGAKDILREYAESIVDMCSNSDKLQILGPDDDSVWIHRDSIQKVKNEL